MVARTESNSVISPRDVIRGVNSQNHNEVGVHWLRISIPQQYIQKLRAYLNFYFGESTKDGYGLWSYDTRFSWPNKASLNFDSDENRADQVHGGKATLDIPGRALDAIHDTDLHLFMLSLRQFKPTCSRIDVFFDDYNRTITPTEIGDIAKKSDYSGFRHVHLKQSYGTQDGRYGLSHDEVDFGRRGGNGAGKFLRVYDKNLESDGEKNCVRFEVEFTKERASKVFEKLSQVTSVEAFATLCGSLVAGSITFVHRDGDKNIGRLRVYDFWERIKELLGSVVIRIPSKKTNIAGKYQWVYKQVSPTLACLRDTFIEDSYFLTWLFDVLTNGKEKMSQQQSNLAKANKRTLRYIDGEVLQSVGGVLRAV